MLETRIHADGAHKLDGDAGKALDLSDLSQTPWCPLWEVLLLFLFHKWGNLGFGELDLHTLLQLLDLRNKTLNFKDALMQETFIIKILKLWDDPVSLGEKS